MNRLSLELINKLTGPISDPVSVALDIIDYFDGSSILTDFINPHLKSLKLNSSREFFTKIYSLDPSELGIELKRCYSQYLIEVVRSKYNLITNMNDFYQLVAWPEIQKYIDHPRWNECILCDSVEGHECEVSTYAVPYDLIMELSK